MTKQYKSLQAQPSKLYLILIIFSILLTTNIYARPLPELEQIIKKLALAPYPGGKSGYSAKIYESNVKIKAKELSSLYKAKEYGLFSSIYYLLPEDELLKFHATTAAKQFNHYLGAAMLVIIIEPNGNLKKIILGKNLMKGEVPQIIIPEGSYIAAKVYSKSNIYRKKHLNKLKLYTLIGCTTSPSWNIKDCIRANYEDLTKKFPQHEKIIKIFT